MSHLTTEQRLEIYSLYKQGYNQSYIAEKIGKHRSVVCRELKRNSDPLSEEYDPVQAQQMYKKRMHEKPKRIKFTPEIRQIVESGLEQGLSPEQIVEQSKAQGIEDMVSHERIYQYVREDKEAGGDLYKHLRYQKSNS